MARYLYEARVAAGGVTSGYVEAVSTSDALAQLERQQLGEIALLDDDTTAALREAWGSTGFKPDSAVEIQLRHDPQPWRFVAHGLRKGWIVYGLMAIGVGYLYSESHFVAAGLLAALALLIALVPGWISWRQNVIHRAYWLGDVETSERVARRLRGMWLLKSAPPALLELDGRIATAMVKRGQVAQGMELMRAWEGSDKVPPAAVRTKVNGLHFTAHDWPAFVAGMEREVELAPESITARIDLAQVLARMGTDDARASALLDTIQPKQYGPLAIAFHMWGRGAISLNRGDNDTAVEQLAVAAGEMQGMAANPLTWGSVALSTGYLALALARAGRRDAAIAMLEPVKAIVASHGETRLLDALKAEAML